MRILFLGDVVGIAGRSKILSNLKAEIERKLILLYLTEKFNDIELINKILAMIFLIGE